jgi:hypothetical protein
VQVGLTCIEVGTAIEVLCVFSIRGTCMLPALQILGRVKARHLQSKTLTEFIVERSSHEGFSSCFTFFFLVTAPSCYNEPKGSREGPLLDDTFFVCASTTCAQPFADREIKHKPVTDDMRYVTQDHQSDSQSNPMHRHALQLLRTLYAKRCALQLCHEVKSSCP